MLAADILEEPKVIARWDDEAAFAENGLGDDGGDRFRSNGTLERVFEVMREGFRCGAFFAAVRIGEGNAVDVAGKRLEAGFLRMGLAGERHGQ